MRVVYIPTCCNKMILEVRLRVKGTEIITLSKLSLVLPLGPTVTSCETAISYACNKKYIYVHVYIHVTVLYLTMNCRTISHSVFNIFMD